MKALGRQATDEPIEGNKEKKERTNTRNKKKTPKKRKENERNNTDVIAATQQPEASSRRAIHFNEDETKSKEKTVIGCCVPFFALPDRQLIAFIGFFRSSIVFLLLLLLSNARVISANLWNVSK